MALYAFLLFEQAVFPRLKEIKNLTNEFLPHVTLKQGYL